MVTFQLCYDLEQNHVALLCLHFLTEKWEMWAEYSFGSFFATREYKFSILNKNSVGFLISKLKKKLKEKQVLQRNCFPPQFFKLLYAFCYFKSYILVYFNWNAFVLVFLNLKLFRVFKMSQEY